MKLRGGALLPLALVLLALAGVLAVMATGPLGVSPGDLLAAAVGRGTPEAELALALRGPRLLAAVTCGAALAGAGAGFQILFRNPLAAPDLLGVSSGAGLGAALALLFGAGAALVQGAAFAGGLADGGLHGIHGGDELHHRGGDGAAGRREGVVDPGREARVV
ncbi:MAG: iron ABC transporter permease, partial [Alphaproteobacteria bacterium]|nr:iron ABC transporter permease [Alphaproteobacteria bacterium]